MTTTSSPIDPEKLDKLAEVAIKVGLHLEKGQDLVLTAPATALPLARRIAAHAYRAGAGLVTTVLSDEELTLARFRRAPDESFDRAPGWLYEGMAKAFEANAARLAVSGDNPMLLSGEDPAKVARANRANSMAYKPALEMITGFDINWNIVAPDAELGQARFPDDSEDEAVRNCRGDLRGEPRRCRPHRCLEAQCRAQGALDLAQRARLPCAPLRGRAPTHGRLADGHRWKGGASEPRTASPATPPRKCSSPHALRVDGHVSSTRRSPITAR